MNETIQVSDWYRRLPPKYINMTFTNRNLHNLSLVTHKFKIEDRRRKVATLLAQAMTETEIAPELKRSIYYRQR